MLAPNKFVVLGCLCLFGVSFGCSDSSRKFTAASEVFAHSCMPCHDSEAKQGGLSLDSVDDILTGGESGSAVVPGDPGSSLLVKRLRGLEGYKVMPPSVGPIDEDDIKTVEDWIVSLPKP